MRTPVLLITTRTSPGGTGRRSAHRNARNPLWGLLGIVAVALLSALGAPATRVHAQPQPPATTSYSHYALEVALSPNRHRLEGRLTIDYVNDSAEAIPAVFFLLLPNYDREPNPYLDPLVRDSGYPQGFDPASLRILSVTDAQGAKLRYELQEGPAIFQTYSLKDALLRVELPRPLPPGETVTLVIRFSTRFPLTTRGDQGRYRDTFTWRFGWYPIAVPAAELVRGEYLAPERPYYRLALPSALQEVTITVPKDYQVAVGADHQEVIAETEETVTVHAISATPVRSVPLVIGKEYRVYEFPYAEVPILVYYLPGHEAAARLIASYAVESLRYYEERWGKYPRRRLVIAETASVKAGFAGAAADALILLNQTFFGEKDLGVPGLVDRFLDFLIAHEVAHQWWGVGIGVDWNAENVLSEGLAQYFSITYFEDKYGAFGPNVFRIEREGILERFFQARFGFLNLREHLEGELPYVNAVRNRFDEAILKPQKDVEFANFSAERIYNKGYMMLRALRGLLGEGAMDELLRAAYERFLYRAITAEEFEALAQEVSGMGAPLREFFENAFRRDGEGGRAPYADYAIADVETKKRPDGSYEHLVFLERKGELRLPLLVQATDVDGNVQSRSWKLEEQQEEKRTVMLFETDRPLAEVELDPERLVPDVYRLDNSYVLEDLSFLNRKLRFVPTGENDLPLDAYLIRFDPINRVLEGGYLMDHRWWLGLESAVGAFVKDFGRGSSLQALAAWSEVGLVGEVRYSQTFFSYPQLGLLGRFWEPTDRLELSLLRRPDSTGDPELDETIGATGRMAQVLGITWVHQEGLRQLMGWWVSLLDDPDAFLRVEVGGWKAQQILPGIVGEVQLRFGWGEGSLGIFQFDLAQLTAFREAAGYPYIGPVRLAGSVGVTALVQRDLNYNVLNFAALHDVRDRVFLAFGDTWTSLDELNETGLWPDLKLQVGFELILSGSTLGGLFPWEVRLGLVYPLRPVAEEERKIQHYYRISTPFF